MWDLWENNIPVKREKRKGCSVYNGATLSSYLYGRDVTPRPKLSSHRPWHRFGRRR